MKRFVLFFIVLVFVLTGCATLPEQAPDIPASDSGYFLSLKQKGQLVWTGRMQDSKGEWYDIWIVPGYVQPGRRAKTYMRKVGTDFGEYVHKQKYEDLATNSGDAFRWAFKDCLVDFTVKGVPRAWGKYWRRANSRTKQRVFGWWFAYPLAMLEGCVDTVVRIPVGVSGTLLGSAWGTVAVPGYYAVNSSVKGSWHLAVDSLLFPATACAWNTVVSPPLVLVGQKPSPSRADGFWVKPMSEDEVLALEPLPPATKEEVEALAQWGLVLQTEAKPFAREYKSLQSEYRKSLQERYEKLQSDQEILKKKEKKHMEAVVNDASQQELISYLRKNGFDRRKTSQAEDAIFQYFQNNKDLSYPDIWSIQKLLQRYPPVEGKEIPEVRSKTDPFQSSIRVIEEMQ